MLVVVRLELAYVKRVALVPAILPPSDYEEKRITN